MRKSTRFPAAVHIMTMLAAQQQDYMSSEIIAGSLNTNRVVVRRLLAMLSRAGLVRSQAGVLGGARLGRKPAEITLLDIYRAVEPEPLFRLHGPHPKCPIANFVCEDLQKVFAAAETSLQDELASQTLAQISRRGTRKMKQLLKSRSN